ncbi:MAG: hypothetical protein FJX42_06200 [Alphaproteobacteria bacterium]|nr:hypothetical protein [Alphaproteobacteria bacterium]
MISEKPLGLTQIWEMGGLEIGYAAYVTAATAIIVTSFGAGLWRAITGRIPGISRNEIFVLLIPAAYLFLVYLAWGTVKTTGMQRYFLAVVPFLVFIGSLAFASRISGSASPTTHEKGDSGP